MKNNKMKKTVSYILSAVLVFSVISAFSVSSFADTCGDYSYSMIDDSSVMIDGYSGTAQTLVIPETLDGYTVTAIGDNAFSGNNSIKNLTIAATVESIGEAAFSGCALESVSIPSSVMSIGGEAFAGCSQLVDIDLPDNGLFAIITSFMETGYFNDPNNWTNGLLCLDNYVLFCNPESTSVTVPDGIKYIIAGAFLGCQSLTSVTLPDSLVAIQYGAFYQCSSLTSIEIPSSITVLPEELFTECTSLESVTLNDGLEIISEKAFSGCSALETLTVPDTVLYIGSLAFENCTALSSVTLSDSLESIEYNTFSYCSALTSIEIPASVERIDDAAFMKCSSLSDITILNPDTIISSAAFSYSAIIRVHGFFNSTADKYVVQNPMNVYTVVYTEVVFIPLDSFIYGDVNDDDDLTIADYALVKQYVSGGCEFDRIQNYVGDMNSDKAIDAFDMFLVHKAIYC